MAAERLIDERVLQDDLAFCEEHHLFLHDERLATDVSAFNAEQPTPFDAFLFQDWHARIAAYRQFHTQVPFITAPGVDGPIVLGRQVANNSMVGIDMSEFARHTLITGSTGTGKTTFAHHLTEQALQHGLNVILLDPKDDARYLAVQYPNVFVLHAQARVNLLRQPSFLSRSEHFATITDRLARSMYSGQTGRAVLHEALTTTYEQTDDPTLLDLFTTLEHLPKKGDTYQRVDAIRAILMRVRRLIDRYPGLATRDAIGIEDLCNTSLLIPAVSYTDTEDCLFSYLTSIVFHHHRTKGIRDLTTVIIIDEGLLALNADDHRISGNPIAELHSMTREFGIAWIVSVNTAALANEQLRNNSYVHVAMNCNSSEDATLLTRTLGLTKEQAAYLQHDLTRGQCIIRLGDRWRHPILATFPERTVSKHVSENEWTAACNRINDQRPTATATRASGSHPATALAPSPAPVPTIAAAMEGHDLSSNALLTATQHAFLTFVATKGVTLVTETYDALRLRPMQGDRLKKRLLDLDLIEQTRIKVGNGRGKEATALTATAIAYNLLGTKRPRVGKGESQHVWILRQLHERITGSAIEVNGADLAIAYNSTKHAALLAALRTTHPAIALNDGDSIAIEVESNPTRTANRNLTRNQAYDLVIIAAPPQHLTSARRIAAQHNRAIVVDVFTFLDGLEIPS